MQKPEPSTQQGGPPSLASLDDAATVERLDPQGLLGRIEALPEQCEEAWTHAGGFELPAGYADVGDVIIVGMGGSAIAGDVLRSLAAFSGRTRVSVVRGYDLPAYVDERALVVACSHSGDTEETLSAIQQAFAAGARTAAVTTGGRLAELAIERDAPLFLYQYDGEARSALGHQLMALLALGQRVGLLEGQAEAVAEAVALMREQRQQLGFAEAVDGNAAKQLAGRLHGHLPVVVGAGVLTEAARRWKTQFNENSKCWALAEELPEFDHNGIEGLRLPPEARDLLRVLFLSHPALHPRLLLRYEATEEVLTEVGVAHERVEAQGSGPLAQVLSAIYLGDLVSYYLGLLNDIAPSPVEALDRLKARLAGQ